ncbi:hypothetical protein HPB51_003132 [Rhipicephalus microplus]|uniref:TRAF-type domain-containing protein n=1 Tax=Rhipicephalus microplus TaxID=6941 RepID=A0A9J6EL53_RHIMP|nr:hypothetical protein HPB51_003132 [Rhipicephalus microplus]
MYSLLWKRNISKAMSNPQNVTHIRKTAMKAPNSLRLLFRELHGECRRKHSLGRTKVPCANAVNGCPAWMLRNQLGSHLQHCPASLVFCTAEWNRWGWRRSETVGDPQYEHRQCADRSGRLQLDFALAMRDLRRLTDEDIRRPKEMEEADKKGTEAHAGVGSTGSHHYPYNGSYGMGVPIASLLNGYINMCEGKNSDLSTAITDAEESASG